MKRLAYRRAHHMDLVEAGKLLIETYQETGYFRDTARRWQGSERGESGGLGVCCERS